MGNERGVIPKNTAIYLRLSEEEQRDQLNKSIKW